MKTEKSKVPKAPNITNERPQVEDFIETARKLGADESREAFERAFSKVTNAPTRKDEPRPIKGSHSE